MATAAINSVGPVASAPKDTDALAKLNAQLTKALNEVPFNPFAMLSTDDTQNEVSALAARFNKTWRATRNDRIQAITAEYACSTSEACFAVWLQDDARAILSRERIKAAADAMIDILPEVLGKDATLALTRIDERYSSVPAIDRPDVGKRVRESAYKLYTGKLAGTMLEIVYKTLEVKEADWKA